MRKTSDIIWQDAQHQVLFDILDMISEPDSDVEVLRKLREYTEYHFSLEEVYMNNLKYPDMKEHIRAHDQFRAEINKLMQQSAAYDSAFKNIVHTFLTEWLTCHVFGIDKRLETFLQLSEVK